MSAIFSRVKWKGRQAVLLSVLVLFAAVAEMMLPSLLAQMINSGVAGSSRGTVLILAAVMAGVTVLACIVNFLSVKIAPAFLRTSQRRFAGRFLKRCKASQPLNLISSARPAWSREAHRILPTFKIFLPCFCGSGFLRR